MSNNTLRGRWHGEEDRIAAIVADLKNQKDWTRHLLASDDGKRRRIPDLDDCGRKAWKTEAAPRDLRGITIMDVDLVGVEGLSDTVLDYATFRNVRLDGVSLNGSSLKGAVFQRGSSLNRIEAQFSSFEGARCRGMPFSEAKIRNANLARGDFRDADLRSTSFIDADLSGCDFRDADLRGVLFNRVKITQEGLFGFLSFRRLWTKFGGHWQTKRDLNEATSFRLRDHIDESSKIRERWRSRRFHALVHYLVSNFGRSATRFGMSTLGGAWLLFAFLYSTLPLKFSVGARDRALTLYDAMYFSAVTITTLGYGDISPATTDGLARFLVGAVAIVGVVILGVFIDRLVRDRPRDWE